MCAQNFYFNLNLFRVVFTERQPLFGRKALITFTPGGCSIQPQSDLWPLIGSTGAVGIKGTTVMEQRQALLFICSTILLGWRMNLRVRKSQFAQITRKQFLTFLCSQQNDLVILSNKDKS